MDLVRLARAEQCVANLVALVDAHMPQAWHAEGDHESWTVAGPALIARAARTASAIFVLRQSGHDSDAAVLLRTLYEYVVTFAWLAADPSPERLLAWVAADYRYRLAAFEEYRSLDVAGLFNQAAVDRFSRRVRVAADRKLSYPNLLQRAQQADERWTQLVNLHAGDGKKYGFTGMYSPIYRMTSGSAHPTPAGIEQFVWTTTIPSVVAVAHERPSSTESTFTISAPVLATGLLVASAALGWPDATLLEAAYFDMPPDWE
jgi:hypothetical protein